MGIVKLRLLLIILAATTITGCIYLNPETPNQTVSSPLPSSSSTPYKKSSTTPQPPPSKTISTRTPTKTKITPTRTVQPENKQKYLLNNWIVYIEPNYLNISVIKLDGTGKRSIVSDRCISSHLSWSPNGDWIAFIGQPICGESSSQIYLVRPDGSEIKRLTYSDVSKDNLSWSPDGRYIVYRQESGSLHKKKFDLFIFDLNLSRTRRITDSEHVPEHNPEFSPDGNQIGFTANGKIFFMNIDGTDMEVIFDDSLYVSSFNWSPDGKRLVFSAGEGSNLSCYDLYLFEVEKNEVVKMVESNHHLRDPVWSNDEEWIGYVNEKCLDNRPTSSEDELYITWINGLQTQKTDISIGADFDLSPSPALETGKTYTITDFGNNLRIRAEPSLSGATKDWLKSRDQVTILEGPSEYDGYLWWHVEVIGGSKSGWVAEIPGYFEDSEVSVNEK